MTDIIERAEEALKSVQPGALWAVNGAEELARVIPVLIAELKSAHAEIEHLRCYKSLPEGMVWQDYYSPDDVNKIRTELEEENGRLVVLYESTHLRGSPKAQHWR